MNDRSMYIYVIRPSRLAMLTAGPTDQEQAALTQHVSYLQQLLAEGRLVLAGRTQDDGERSFGIVIFYADSAEQAAETLQSDPPVRAGVFSGEVFPYAIAFKSFEL